MKKRSSIPATPQFRQMQPSSARSERAQQFRDFSATELYCPKCKQAQPVRERLLLVLPSGDLFDYLCSVCGDSLGKRETRGAH